MKEAALVGGLISLSDSTGNPVGFELAGVEFIDENGGGPVVLLPQAPANKINQGNNNQMPMITAALARSRTAGSGSPPHRLAL
jgi:hypothetical protein